MDSSTTRIHEHYNANNNSERERENEERNNKELEKLIGSQEVRIQNLQSTAFQLANYFFVFQGVIVAATSTATNLSCSVVWYIFILSLFAALLNLFALLSIASKYVRAMNLHDRTWSDYNQTAAPMGRNRSLQRRYTGDFTPGNTYQGEGGVSPERRWRDAPSRRRYLVLAVCMALFMAFTAVTLAGPWVITCKRDHRVKENRARGPGSDCLRVCGESGRCMSFCQDV